MGGESQNDVCAINAVVFNGAGKIPISLRDDPMTAVGVFMNTDCIVYLYNETTLGIFFPSYSFITCCQESTYQYV